MTIALTPTLQIHGKSFFEVTATAPILGEKSTAYSQVVGSFILVEHTHWIHGSSLTVLPSHRRQGIAGKIMAEALAFAGNRKALYVGVEAFETHGVGALSAEVLNERGPTDAQLFEWYYKLGFARVMASPNQMARFPR